MARSSALLQGLEVGTVRLAGHHPAFEGAAVQWQAGQHQPDSLAALVVAHDVLVHAVSQRWSFASPVNSARRTRDPMGRGTARTLGGRRDLDTLARTIRAESARAEQDTPPSVTSLINRRARGGNTGRRAL